MIDDEKDKVYVEIDVQGLAEELASEAYNQETKDVPEKDKVTTEIIHRNGRMSVETDINSHWSTLYWNLQIQYWKLCMQFSKKKQDDRK